MGKPAAKKAMAKAKTVPKATPKATAKELKKQEQERAAKKKDQSNLVTSLKNAKNKLQGVQAGTIAVSDGGLEALKSKADFFDRYVSLDRNDPEKAQMLRIEIGIDLWLSLLFSEAKPLSRSSRGSISCKRSTSRM